MTRPWSYPFNSVGDPCSTTLGTRGLNVDPRTVLVRGKGWCLRSHPTRPRKHRTCPDVSVHTLSLPDTVRSVFGRRTFSDQYRLVSVTVGDRFSSPLNKTRRGEVGTHGPPVSPGIDPREGYPSRVRTAHPGSGPRTLRRTALGETSGGRRSGRRGNVVGEGRDFREGGRVTDRDS